MSREALEFELKELLVETLMLEDQVPAEIDSSQPLFVDGLGLDSIDALELGIAISKRYGFEIDSNDESTHKAFASISALAQFVADKRK